MSALAAIVPHAFSKAHQSMDLYMRLMDGAQSHGLTVTASVIGGMTRSGVVGHEGDNTYTATVSEDGAVTRTENGREVAEFNRFARIGSSVERMLRANIDNFIMYDQLDREVRMAAATKRTR